METTKKCMIEQSIELLGNPTAENLRRVGILTAALAELTYVDRSEQRSAEHEQYKLERQQRNNSQES